MKFPQSLVAVLAFTCGTLALHGAETPKAAAAKSITLATTTSVQDTGLLDKLLPVFKSQTGIDVKVLAVGTGQAMEIAKRGDADILFTHAPKAEEEFLKTGPGLKRFPLMHNDFVILGPAADPAKIKAGKDAAAAFAKIAQAKALFVSRGDNSGTNMKEKSLWEKAKTKPAGAWYLSSGSGMAEALRLTQEKKAYTLSDRATYLSQKKNLDLIIAVEGDPDLLNKYSVIELDPKKLPHIKAADATKFREFMFGPEARKIIEVFGKEKYGQPLFFLDK